MTPNYFCRKILSEDHVNSVKKLITAENINWIDGKFSVFEYTLPLKKLVETFNQNVFNIIMSELDKDVEFNSIVIPKETNNLIISKITEGGYYKCHLDSELNGNYSTTIFLNEPNEYEGGELQLLIDGHIKNIKLKAGWGVTYETGIPHQVLPVTKGVRYAAIFWTISLLSDPFIRNMHNTLSNIELKLKEKGYTEEVHTNIKQFVEDPLIEIAMLKKDIIRRYRY